MQIDQHILIRYFLKQASEEEKEVIRQWIESSEDNRRRFIRERIRFDASILVDEAAVEPSTKIASGKRYRRHPALNWSLKVAASILILLGSFYLYDNYRMARLAQTLQCVYVPAGNRTNIQLPDGTSVWLNANTSLRYPMAFAENSREIMLDGEAYFEVAKDVSAPFHVYVKGGEVTVLGTSFNISAYKEDVAWQTTLVSGRVQVEADDRMVVMKPTEQYSVDRHTGEGVLKEVDTELYTSWVDGKFYFNAYAFEDIVKKLERWYDFTMNYQDEEIKRMHFSGTINKHRPLNEVLQFLEKTTDIHFEISGKNITVSKIKKG